MVDISDLIRLGISVFGQQLKREEEPVFRYSTLYIKGKPAIRSSYDARRGVLSLSCSINGEPYQGSIGIAEKSSNLGIGGSYYYFVCPITGRRCRYLYLYGGRFVSRFAIPTLLYPSQMYQARSSALIRGIDTLLELEKFSQERYRKEYYRGKQTPWGRRITKAYERYKPFELLLFGSSPS